MNNVIVYEKTITVPTIILLLLNINKDYIMVDLDYWRCIYNNTIFNVPIKEMPDTIVGSMEVPPIVLEQLIRINYE